MRSEEEELDRFGWKRGDIAIVTKDGEVLNLDPEAPKRKPATGKEKT